MAFRLLILLLLVSSSWAVTYPALNTNSSFLVYSTDSESCQLSTKIRSAARSNGFVKMVCPFGIPVVGTKRYPDDHLLFGANIIANLIDQDENGIPDSTDLLEALKGKTALVCGDTQTNEDRIDRFQRKSGLQDMFGCQTWQTEGKAVSKAILFEEAFHLVHQMGYATIFPEQFDANDFTSSTVCRETARLQCVRPGWWHPENLCPAGAPFSTPSSVASPLRPDPQEGDCTAPDCDCMEFYRQAITLYTGWSDDENDTLEFWYSPYMPKNATNFRAMVSQELMDIMSDPQYLQMQNPLSGVYTVQGVLGTTPDATVSGGRIQFISTVTMVLVLVSVVIL